MKVFLASDHGGFELKGEIAEYLKGKGYDVEDLGPFELDPADDYPDYAYKATTALLDSTEEARAILLCRSAQGMAIAANRAPGIRAAVVWNEIEAKKSREHNNANVLCLSADNVEPETNIKITDIWLNEPFSDEPRHQRRLDKIEKLYGK